MTLFYAFGGGFGHLTRAKKVCEALKLVEVKILSSNHLAYKLFKEDEVLFFPPPLPGKTEKWIEDFKRKLRTRSFSTLYIDVFPNGILGELPHVLEGLDVRLHLIARHIKWPAYANKIQNKKNLTFDSVYVVEELHPAQREYLINRSRSIRRLNLNYHANAGKAPMDLGNFGLVLHAFNELEVRYLVLQAERLCIQKNIDRIVLISDQKVDTKKVVCIDTIEPQSYFPTAKFIVSGGGFNTMKQLEQWTNKHYPFPFSRRYDDQKLRILQMKLYKKTTPIES